MYRTRLKWMFVGLTAVGLAAGLAWAAGEHGDHAGGSSGTKGADGEKAPTSCPAGMATAHQSIANLDTLLQSARKSAEAGDAKAAAAEIAKAQEVLGALKEQMKACSMAKSGKPANAKCPIMGGKIDPANVKPELTRQFKSQTIAFCCAGCPLKWDKMDDTQKQANLDQHKAGLHNPTPPAEQPAPVMHSGQHH